MAKGKKTKSKKAASNVVELLLGGGKGVQPLKIAEIDAAAKNYEFHKDKRCEASPGEISAKQELKKLLLKNRERLHEDPLTKERFYRLDGKDYVLTEKLSMRKVDDGSVDRQDI